MGGPIPTESNINMTGAGLVGKSTSGSGKSGRMSQASVLSWLGLSASGVTDGKALIASSNSIAWSPSAAALLPDTLPAAGTLLSYGGSRQLAAGGTVSHSGALTLGGQLQTAAGTTSLPAIWSTDADSGIIFSGNNTQVVVDGTVAVAFAGGGIGARFGNDIGFAATATGTMLHRIGNTSGTLKIKSDAAVAFRNMADSADAAITAGAITANGVVNVTPKVEVIYSGTTPATPAYGSIALVGTTFSSSPYIGGGLCSDRLQGLWFPDGVPVMGTRTSLAAGATFTTWLAFGSTTGVGGQTSSFPGFNASGTTFRIRLADNSADAPLSAGAITASGTVMETPTQSSINPTTVNIPSGQRRGWYNSTLAEFRDWVNIGGTLLKSAAYT